MNQAFQKGAREPSLHKNNGRNSSADSTSEHAQNGHREGEAELNPRNVLKLLFTFVAKHNPVITDRVRSGPKNAKYVCIMYVLLLHTLLYLASGLALFVHANAC